MASILYQATPHFSAAALAEQARTARINAMGQFAASIAHEVNQPLADSGAIVHFTVPSPCPSYTELHSAHKGAP